MGQVSGVPDYGPSPQASSRKNQFNNEMLRRVIMAAAASTEQNLGPIASSIVRWVPSPAQHPLLSCMLTRAAFVMKTLGGGEKSTMQRAGAAMGRKSSCCYTRSSISCLP